LRVRGRDDEWTDLMRLAIAGDRSAYHRLLKSVTPVLRIKAQQKLARPDQAEDIVQETLLAVHLKRHTWDASAPFAPWLFAIARNKLIDALRRQRHWAFLNIDDFTETLPSNPPSESLPSADIAKHFPELPPRQRDVLQSIAIDSASIKATATKLSVTDGAVRVALHRGLVRLAAILRKNES
jgi:RNA polymerase sigma-70 factor, ECF subfamily